MGREWERRSYPMIAWDKLTERLQKCVLLLLKILSGRFHTTFLQLYIENLQNVKVCGTGTVLA